MTAAPEFSAESRNGGWVVAWGQGSACVFDVHGRFAEWQHDPYDRQWRHSAVACLIAAQDMVMRQVPPPYGPRNSDARADFCRAIAAYATERWRAEAKGDTA